MVPVSLTMNDELFNPFSTTTLETLYMQPERTEEIDSFYDQPRSGINIKIEIMLSDEMIIQSRSRYNYWQALGDIGGFYDGLRLLFSFFMASYSAAMF